MIQYTLNHNLFDSFRLKEMILDYLKDHPEQLKYQKTKEIVKDSVLQHLFLESSPHHLVNSLVVWDCSFVDNN